MLFSAKDNTGTAALTTTNTNTEYKYWLVHQILRSTSNLLKYLHGPDPKKHVKYIRTSSELERKICFKIRVNDRVNSADLQEERDYSSYY
jgi:hypothetical protein